MPSRYEKLIELEMRSAANALSPDGPVRLPKHYGLNAGTVYMFARPPTIRQRIGLWLVALPGRVSHRVRVILRCRWR